jgi:hypothetical protein
MIRLTKDQLLLYQKFAVARQSYAPLPVEAAKNLARAELKQPTPPPAPPSKPVREPISANTSALASMLVSESSKLVHGQQNLIQELVTTCEKLQREIVFWKDKAETASATKGAGNMTTREGDRIDAIRKMLARELHPDAPNISPVEAALRMSLFKTIWPKIDQIVKGRLPA